MLLFGLKLSLILVLGPGLLVLEMAAAEKTSREVPDRIERLDGLSCVPRLSASSSFAILLAEFLIKREPNEP